jgi:hypothetical protein
MGAGVSWIDGATSLAGLDELEGMMVSEELDHRAKRIDEAESLALLAAMSLAASGAATQPAPGSDVHVVADVVADRVVERLTEQREAVERPLPVGMSAWVCAADVERAVGCSASKAHEYVRAAAGRDVGTGQLLRVPVDIWEAWARSNLINGRRRSRWERPSTSTSGGRFGGAGSTTTTALASGEPPARPTRRRLAPGLQSGSVLPLIPTLKSRKA